MSDWQASAAPSGVAEVYGRVLAVEHRPQECPRNPYAAVWKMLVVTAAGWRIDVTVPRAVIGAAQREASILGWRWPQVLVGRRVLFTATVRPDPADPARAVGERPRRAELLAPTTGGHSRT